MEVRKDMVLPAGKGKKKGKKGKRKGKKGKKKRKQVDAAQVIADNTARFTILLTKKKLESVRRRLKVQ